MLAVLFAITVCIFASAAVSAAKNKYSVTPSCDSTYIYTYEKNTFIKDVSSASALYEYNIKNETSQTVKFSSIKVCETLVGNDYSYGDTVYDTGVIELMPGEDITLAGHSFTYDDAESFVLQYDILAVMYSEDESGNQIVFSDSDYESIINGGDTINITREKIDYTVVYDYFTSGSDVYADDTITLKFSIESNSSVPLQNIEVTDSVFGKIGVIDTLEPGKTESVSKSVKITGSVKSHPSIKFEKYNDIKTYTDDCNSAEIEITVLDYSYSLTIEAFTEVVYIENNQVVEIEFTITNTGTGTVENIAVIDNNNSTVFSISSLPCGDVYTKMVSKSFRPDETYTFRCISPRTESVSAELSFKTLPQVELSYSFDKKLSEYSYLDTVNIKYAVSNNGSIDAEKLVLTDSELNQSWEIGDLASGESREIMVSVQLLKEETTFHPVLTGKYAETGAEINEDLPVIKIEVKLPSLYVDPVLQITTDQKNIYSGDMVPFTLVLKNNGNGALKTYSITVVETDNLFVSEGRLDPGASKTFTTEIFCKESTTFTFRLSGKNSDTGEPVVMDFTYDVEVLNADPTPIETPEPHKTHDPKATVDPGETEKELTDPAKNILKGVFIIAIAALALLVVTIIILIVSLVAKIRTKLNRPY